MSRRKRMMEDLEQDIRDFIERETHDNIERGMPPEEAHYATLRKFGNVTRIKEDTWEVWSCVWLEQLWQDVRYGLRMLAKNPGFTVVAVTTLALGMGAAAAVFSVIDQALFSPLPLPESQRLVAVYNYDRKAARYVSTSFPDYQDFRDRSRSFENLSAYARLPLNVVFGASVEPVSVELVSANYFAMLRLEPLLGRALDPTDALAPVVMVSEDFWRGRLGDEPTVIGKGTVKIEDHVFRVIGVVPRRYQGVNLNWGDPPQIWAPLGTLPLLIPRFAQKGILNQRAARWIVLLGRLNPGVSTAQGEAELRVIAADLAQAEPATNADITVAAFPANRSKFWPAYRRPVAQSLGMFGAAASLLLLLACANFSSLLLERAFVRGREMGIRIALGAGRGRLLRQSVTEVLLLVCASFAASLLVIHTLDNVLSGFPAAFGLPLALDLRIDSRVLLFGVLLSLVTAVLCALAPALQAGGQDIVPFLKERGKAPLHGHAGEWQRRTLVVAQVAFSAVLLTVCGVFVRGTWKAYRIDLGFRPRNLLIMSYALQTQLDQQAEQAFAETARRKVSGIPGVAAVATAWGIPLDAAQSTMPMAGAEGDATGEMRATYNAVGPDYFAAMGIDILAGREFSWRDTEHSQGVAIINQTLAERVWHGSNPVGRSIILVPEPGRRVSVEVVGLARDSKYRSVWEDSEPYLYLAGTQWPMPMLNLLVRTRGEPRGLRDAIQREWKRSFPATPLYRVESGDEHVQTSLAPQRLAAGLFSAFAGVAAVVAAIGLYGVMAFSVSRRKNEIGIRLAIGATPSTVVRAVLGSALRLVVLGLALGAAVALAFMRLIAPLVRGVSPYDLSTLGGVALLLCLASAAAAFIPARRATMVDPIVALRHE